MILMATQDFIWNSIDYDMQVHIHPFKFRLYKDAFSCVSSHVSWLEFMTLCSHRILKNEPTDVFFGLSPRGFLIHTSENILKPIHGSDYFGKAIVEDAPKDGIILVPDGGFISELKTLMMAGEYHEVVQVHRNGCTFEGDSRDWIATNYKIENNSEISTAISSLHEIVKECGIFNTVN